jgi:hypothetical protein
MALPSQTTSFTVVLLGARGAEHYDVRVPLRVTDRRQILTLLSGAYPTAIKLMPPQQLQQG